MKLEKLDWNQAKLRFREYHGWFVAASLALAVGLGILASQAPAAFAAILEGFPYTAVSLVLSGIILLVTLLSYSRVYKLKVLLTGFLVTSIFLMLAAVRVSIPLHSPLSGTEWNLASAAEKLPSFTARFLSFVVMLNLLAVMIVPSRVNYTAGRKRSVLPLVFNLAVWIPVLFLLSAWVDSSAVRQIQVHFIQWFRWLMLGLFVAIAALSAFRIEEDHNFGAVIVSLALVLLVASFQPRLDARFLSFLALLGLLALAGVVYHVLESLKYGARIDPLLKIWNRQYMGAIVSGVAEVHLGSRFSVAISDIDHFKHVNDTHGHQAGDAVLYAVAQCIRKAAEPEGVVCRYGGEELVVFMKNLVGKEARDKAEAIRKAVEKLKVVYARRRIPVAVSIGVAGKEGGDKSIEALIKAADERLYEAKRTGRNKVVAG